MFGVKASPPLPLPPTGPAILVCNHTSMGDPLVLLAAAVRPIRFLMTEEIYSRPFLSWAFRAVQCIPVRRGKRDVLAIRTMLDVLAADEVIGLFPEGGLEDFRRKEGYLGIGYVALKSGAPVYPVSIVWERPRPLTILRTLLEPCRCRIAFGHPLHFSPQPHPEKVAIKAATRGVMNAIENLRKDLLSA